MKNDMQLKKLANSIADSIVELVECTDGPVTLARIEREVPGFASCGQTEWRSVSNNGTEQVVLWDGMTEAGFLALQKVIHGHKVAVQFVSILPYLLQGRCVQDEGWLPIMLVPAQDANLKSPIFLVNASSENREFYMKASAAEGKRGLQVLTPRVVRSGQTNSRFEQR